MLQLKYKKVLETYRALLPGFCVAHTPVDAQRLAPIRLEVALAAGNVHLPVGELHTREKQIKIMLPLPWELPKKCWTRQCCGSGSAWIRNFCLDPDPAKYEKQVNNMDWIRIRMDPELLTGSGTQKVQS